MIRFKNNAGFTLVDVMIAIAIVGIVLTPMFVLQNNVMGSAIRLSERFHRLLRAKNFLFIAQEKEPAKATDYSVEKKEERPNTMLSYSLKPVAKDSVLAKLQYLYTQQVQAKDPQGDNGASIVQIIYKPKQEA